MVSVGDVGVKDAEAKDDDTATGVSENLWFYADQHVPELMEFVARACGTEPHAYHAYHAYPSTQA